MSFDPDDIGRSGSEPGDSPVNFHGELLAGACARVFDPCDGTGGVGVDDEGSPPVSARSEPCEGSVDGGRLRIKRRLPGAQ
jgi:hypothetical protein